MFSPTVPHPPSAGRSLRNPRRRQRTSSDELTNSLPRAKRQRSTVSAATFAKAQQENVPPEDMPTMNGHANHAVKDITALTQELAVREKKSGERGARGDGAVILTKNDQYAVSKLPAWPDRLRHDSNDRLVGSIYGSSSYALALTASHALIWQYTANISSPETFSISLPQTTKRPTDSPPLGTLVLSSASSAEPGLVIVWPTTGKIIYWESIATAATLDLVRQQRHGVEGTVGSLFSGETVIHIEDTEPAGYVLSFSSGRVALLSVRDGQGRPAITVNFIRSNGGGSVGGLFGGLRNVFGSNNWRRDVAAVKAGPARRGERDLVVATARGVLQLWTVHRGGHHALLAEVDAKNDLLVAIRKGTAAREAHLLDDLELLDVTFSISTPNGHGGEVAMSDTDAATKLLVLVAMNRDASTLYTLVEAELQSTSITVRSVHPINCYSSPAKQMGPMRPRLLLPKPGHTAFVAFNRAVALVSVSRQEDSPEQQLLASTDRLPDPFEDVVDLRQGLNVEIAGCGEEDGRDAIATAPESHKGRQWSVKNPSCVLLIRGGGVVRVTAHTPPDDIEARQPVTAKAKIEQAIKYGIEPRNLLSFSSLQGFDFPLEEVERAALTISKEILSSDSKTVASVTPSMEHSLNQRALMVRELALFLKTSFPPRSRRTKWMLLWHAERLAAAKNLWSSHNSRLRQKTDKESGGLLAHLIDNVHEDHKTEVVPERGEIDRVRQWFAKDVGSMEILLPWALKSTIDWYKEGVKDHRTILFLLDEANEIVAGALETAFRFREENVGLYGLEKEPLHDGVLQQGYLDLPQVWTSRFLVLSGTRRLVDLGTAIAVKYLDHDIRPGSPDPDAIRRIAEANPRLLELNCRLHVERIKWTEEQRAEGFAVQARELKAEYLAIRPEQINRLGTLALFTEGRALAAKYDEMPSLVGLTNWELRIHTVLNSDVSLDDEAKAVHAKTIKRLQDLHRTYFEKYGDDYAAAFFKAAITDGTIHQLLGTHDEHQESLDRFLHKQSSYTKLSWINDVLGQQKFGLAGESLVKYGQQNESILWRRQLELSVGKLSLLAGQDVNPQSASTQPKGLAEVDRDLDLINIQSRLHQHINIAFQTALASDEINLALKYFGERARKETPALRSVLEQGIIDVAAGEDIGPKRLIDLLTIMDHHFPVDQPGSLMGQQYYLALKVLRLAPIPDKKTVAPLLEKMIWRRCVLQDNWIAINDTQLKHDEAVEEITGNTALFRTLREGFKTDLWTTSVPLRPLEPTSLLGTGCDPASLQPLFPEDLRPAIAADMRNEDARLRRYIEKGRLADWYRGIVEAAKKSVQDEVEREEEVAMQMREVEEELGLVSGTNPEEPEQTSNGALMNGFGKGHGYGHGQGHGIEQGGRHMMDDANGVYENGQQEDMVME
ncbi:MAG: hypothetical protein M1817_006052 [Caeruleum heppii]|nr:MAG: hypothetical protein M1817_006052 [Caeruleum heppii]